MPSDLSIHTDISDVNLWYTVILLWFIYSTSCYNNIIYTSLYIIYVHTYTAVRIHRIWVSVKKKRLGGDCIQKWAIDLDVYIYIYLNWKQAKYEPPGSFPPASWPQRKDTFTPSLVSPKRFLSVGIDPICIRMQRPWLTWMLWQQHWYYLQKRKRYLRCSHLVICPSVAKEN